MALQYTTVPPGTAPNAALGMRGPEHDLEAPALHPLLVACADGLHPVPDPIGGANLRVTSSAVTAALGRFWDLTQEDYADDKVGRAVELGSEVLLLARSVEEASTVMREAYVERFGDHFAGLFEPEVADKVDAALLDYAQYIARAPRERQRLARRRTPSSPSSDAP